MSFTSTVEVTRNCTFEEKALSFVFKFAETSNVLFDSACYPAAVAEWSKASNEVLFDALGPGFESRLGMLSKLKIRQIVVGIVISECKAVY